MGVAGLLMGGRRLFEFAHGNPLVRLEPTTHTHAFARISAQPKVVMLTGALQVDLTGQVDADSIGSRVYSGIGGQVDFIRGAARSAGGRPVIALNSTARARLDCSRSPAPPRHAITK